MYLLTVSWCNNGKRGLFANRSGKVYFEDQPLNENATWQILGPFDLILDPKWIEMTEDEAKQYTMWFPLAEYQNQWGIVYKPEDVEV